VRRQAGSKEGGMKRPYTVDEITEARNWLIGFRDRLMDEWPDTAEETAITTNIIAMLHELIATKQ
jgi:hypothetical protein